MCGSTYQTRKSYWWTQAVQAFELAEHVHDGLVHHEGEKNISYTVGGKLHFSGSMAPYQTVGGAS